MVCGIGRSHEKLAEEREFLTPTQLSPTRRILNRDDVLWPGGGVLWMVGGDER